MLQGILQEILQEIIFQVILLRTVWNTLMASHKATVWNSGFHQKNDGSDVNILQISIHL
jgi:hypothetical protein